MKAKKPSRSEKAAVTKKINAEIIITESNDPRSYRQDSSKLLKTGFKPQYSVNKAIEDIIEA